MPNEIKVLVVEDVEIAQKIAKLVLIKLGCHVDIADHGQQALTLFRENQYDLIFMDIGLPDINGIEVTKKIREIEPPETHVPIVALTANFDESYKPACVAAGMDYFMLKPLTKEKGQALIEKLVASDD